MKYGLVVFKDTDNLGDDILSYAAKRFLPKVDYIIDREAMDIFVPSCKEKVAVIANGWYLHRTYALPPTSYIEPLFVGTHFTRGGIIGDYSYLDGYMTDYLKEHEAIGCRDTSTLKQMKLRGIDAYFSGCMTMTIQPFEGVEKCNKIVLLDVSKAVELYVRRLMPGKEVVCRTHNKTDEQRGLHWQETEKLVEERLREYQSADLIITTRLHGALPSMALGTPVLLIGRYDKDYKERISDFSEYVMTFSEEDVLGRKADEFIRNPVYTPFPVEIVSRLEQTCKKFIDKMSMADDIGAKLPDTDEFTSLYIKKAAHDRMLFDRQWTYSFYTIKKQQEELCDVIAQREMAINDLYKYSVVIVSETTEDGAWRRAVLDCIKYAAQNRHLTLQNRYYICRQLEYRIERQNAGYTQELMSALTELYGRCLEEYKKSLTADLLPITQNDRNGKLTIVLTEQFTDACEGACADVLNGCVSLQQQGENVLLINTAEKLTSVGAVAFCGSKAAEYNSTLTLAESIEYNGRNIPYFQCGDDMPNVNSLDYLVSTMRGLKPHKIVSYCSGSILEALLREILPE